MANKISFVSGETLLEGRVVQVQSDDSVVYVDSPITSSATPSGITFEPGVSGSYVTVYAPGSAQVPCTASGSIAAGGLVQATTDGKVIAFSAPVSSSWVLGTAETDGADGNPVYITFNPFVVAPAS
jgi:hypothetical protein